MPVNYLNGKIYKIVDNTNGNIYIGSTAEPTLARRLAGHVRSYKSWCKGKGRLMRSFDIIKNGDYRIVLIDSCPCYSKDELTSREQEHMDNNECVNQVRAFVSEEQRKEYQKKRSARHHIDNKEKLNIGRKDLREYCITWGGDRRSHNNLLEIDPNLFDDCLIVD